nr:ATP-dependent DNA helicase [Pseudomonadota bacterium]
MVSFDDAALLLALKKFFGYDAFRPGQMEIVRHILNGEDVLAVMPTGAGKSLCFQLPAVLGESSTIVVSPLVALMNDQTAALKDMGIEAAAIHSGRSREDNGEAWRQFSSGQARLLYMSPEGLMKDYTIGRLQELSVGTIVIDEAHCISKWGPSFRPDYEALSTLKEHFPEAAVAAFTATADRATRQDITNKLSNGKCKVILRGFDRPNLSLAVESKTDIKKKMLEFLRAQNGSSGIVYCLSRNETDETAEYLDNNGVPALAYHAGKDSEDRRRLQDRFMTEDGLVMVATIAFGMGIDKPDIRFVVHASLPGSVEAFYQEIGRAGRDGAPAQTLLYYGLADLVKRQRMIFEGDAQGEFKMGEHNRLQALIGYCETHTCRRQTLLAYFDEESKPCGNCDNCLDPPQVTDYTEQARTLLQAVKATGQYFGASHLVDVVRGANTAKVMQRNHNTLACFGKGAGQPKAFYDSLLRQLIASGTLKINFQKYGALQLTPAAQELLKGNTTFAAKPPPVRKQLVPTATPKARAN